MSEEHAGLESDGIVYRAVTRGQWIDEDTGELKPDAFLRREADEDGISVYIQRYCSPEWVAAKFNRTKAVISVRVGDLRALGLEVVPDPPESPDYPEHACITGLPFHDDDPARAVFLAERIAAGSQFGYRRAASR
jgi:hypothetical protein